MHEHFIIPFGSELWIFGLFGFLIGCIGLITLGRYFQKQGTEPKYRKILFWILLIREIALYSYIIYVGKFTIQDSLPFHLCNISYIGLVLFLFKPNAFLFEFLLLLSFGGAVQSLFTPELTHGYSIYLVIDYYFSHGAILFTPLYAYFVLRMRPRDYSWIKIWIAGHVVLASVGLINWLLHSNYIYLCQPPKVNNPLVTGGFPYHLLGFELFGSLHILLLYFLFKYVFRAIKSETRQL